MVQFIVGEKGKGKTKHLLDKVNSAASTAKGNLVYVDKSSKHMYEIKNSVRLIDISEYPINSTDEFTGFICGIVSQDHDLSEVYLDSFLKLSYLEGSDKFADVCKKISKISEQFSVDFTISVSLDEKDIPEEFKSSIIVSL